MQWQYRSRMQKPRFLAALGMTMRFYTLAAQSICLQADLTDAPRNIYRAPMPIPAQAGEMPLVFPKW